MAVNETKEKFVEAKKAVENCTKSIQELQAKADQLQDSLPVLTRAVEDAEKAKLGALDNFAMTSNKQTESSLRIARTACEQAVKQRAETNELVEATARAFKKQEQELVRLNNAYESAKREGWKAVFDEIRVSIPSEVFENVQKLFIIGSQTGQTRQWILDSLFQNLSSGEHQEITNELCKKYNID